MTLALPPNKLLRSASLLGFSAVLLGAFGAHALKEKITAEMLAVFEVGCRYHLTHALALLALAGVTPFFKEKTLRWVNRCWCLGVIVFSGSLYALAISGVRQWGAVTPFGGLLLMSGWTILFLGTLQQTISQKN